MKRRTAGFTLLEVLVSTSIGALLIAVAWSAFSQARHTALRVQAQVELSARARSIYETLRADLAAMQQHCAMWLVSKGPNADIELVFAGSIADDFEFRTTGQAWNNWPSDLVWRRWSWDMAGTTLACGSNASRRTARRIGTVARGAETLAIDDLWIHPQPRRTTPSDLVTGLDENGWLPGFPSQTTADGDYTDLLRRMSPVNRTMTACHLQLVLDDGSVLDADGSAPLAFCSRGLRMDGMTTSQLAPATPLDEFAKRPAILRLAFTLRDAETRAEAGFSFSFALPGPLKHL